MTVAWLVLAPAGLQIKDLTEGVEEGTVWDGGGHRYQLEKVVGNGAFGIVWRARCDDGDVVAIKKVMLDRRYHNRELQMMKVMEHENVVRLRHYFEKAGRKKDETFLYLVMDYLPETIRSVALKHHKRAKRFHVDHIKAYLWQTFRALEYIHARRICHRDIKPDNLLCDPSSLKARLCDFGCSKVLVKGQPNVSYICSRYYRAPELMFGATEYSVSVDVWSVGTILMELLLGHLPFQGQDSTQQHLVEIMKLLGTPTDRDLQAMRATCCADDLPKLKPYPWERVFPANTPPEAVDLAQRLLRYDPDERLTSSMALAHPFFDGVDQLIEGNADGSSGTPMAAHAPHFEAAANRESLSLSEWENKVLASFAVAADFVDLSAGSVGLAVDEVANTLSGGKLGEEEGKRLLARATNSRTRKVHELIKAVCTDASQFQLPYETNGGAAHQNGDGQAGSSSAAAEDTSALRAELERVAAEKRGYEAIIQQREHVARELSAAKQQLAASAAGGGDGDEGAGGGDRATPGFGRRANGPCRQATAIDVGVSPATSQKLPVDNLGQVTPLGAASSSPDVGARGNSASGRRRRGAEGDTE